MNLTPWKSLFCREIRKITTQAAITTTLAPSREHSMRKMRISKHRTEGIS